MPHRSPAVSNGRSGFDPGRTWASPIVDKTVADALPTFRVARFAPADIIFRRFGRTPIANRAVFLPVSVAQIAEITEAEARGIGAVARCWQLHDLERKAGGRGERIGEHADFAFLTELQGLAFEVRPDADSSQNAKAVPT